MPHSPAGHSPAGTAGSPRSVARWAAWARRTGRHAAGRAEAPLQHKFFVTLHGHRLARLRALGIFKQKSTTLTVEIDDKTLRHAAGAGEAAFLECIANAALAAGGGTINAECLQRLSANQMTLVAYMELRREVLEGGFVQLIYNGYGPLFFRNPFARAVRAMGADELATLINGARRHYHQIEDEAQTELSDEDFMALYEQHPEMERYDDRFVEGEPSFTSIIAHYVDEHLADFCTVTGTPPQADA